MRKWTKGKALSQLALADADRLEDTYLYKLSQQKGLEYFKHIYLMASRQDKYASFYSARIQPHTAATDTSGNSSSSSRSEMDVSVVEGDERTVVYMKMVRGLLGFMKDGGVGGRTNTSTSTTNTSTNPSESEWKTRLFHRLDVCFPDPDKGVDSVIGRAAHIDFLENNLYMRMFLKMHWQAFV